MGIKTAIKFDLKHCPNKGRELERAIAIDNAHDDGRELKDITSEGRTIIPDDDPPGPTLPQVDGADMDDLEV